MKCTDCETEATFSYQFSKNGPVEHACHKHAGILKQMMEAMNRYFPLVLLKGNPADLDLCTCNHTRRQHRAADGFLGDKHPCVVTWCSCKRFISLVTATHEDQVSEHLGVEREEEQRKFDSDMGVGSLAGIISETVDIKPEPFLPGGGSFGGGGSSASWEPAPTGGESAAVLPDPVPSAIPSPEEASIEPDPTEGRGSDPEPSSPSEPESSPSESSSTDSSSSDTGGGGGDSTS